ncbi:uncharacterized protein Z518_02350 [Rhinocladiella mackenziei CBS 650.93]|uniref:Alcohol dehydrogenase-like C-terminal domain-containing protein n=1 Tax=Rhinocladiella mackenziei CBS 650.93 TaxID=1442369 RepID=A0A0D2IWH5_9EURO|nr:uncharacterized protein Z518_02350 [Rhinocladiella mackenziei CBS 650.93]KIX07696.1 hypothetical protein Z518_02350 [Rhinocladiella mackenziei CBS 650.93]
MKSFTTASPKNFAYLESLGASKVKCFDYRSPTVAEDVAAGLKSSNGPLAGVIDCTSVTNAVQTCASILSLSNNADKIIATVLPPPETITNARRIFGLSLKENEVGKAIYEDFLPEALSKGTFIPAPEPMVVGTGLEAMQAAFDAQKAGVSAKKVIVKL